MIFFAVVAAVIVDGKPPPRESEAREPVFSVRAATAHIAPARPSVLLSGETEARDYAVLTAPAEAEVLSVAFREGETFAKNSRLVRMDLREQRLEAESRRAAAEGVRLQIAAQDTNREADKRRLAETRNLLELARRDYARNITLQAKNLVTRARIEDAERAVSQRRQELIALQNQVDNYPLEKRRLEQQLAAAEVALKQAELLIERGEMRAPFAGRVAKVAASAGTRAARGAPLMEIFNPASVRLRALVPSRYAHLLAGGGASRAVLEYDGGAHNLPLSNVSPRTEAGKGGVEAFFDLPPGDWVLGTTFEFQLQLPAAAGALELPFDAIYAESRIYTIDEDDRARGTECDRLGVSRGAGGVRALLRCPQIAEGDRIIATQLPGIAEGAKVRVLAATP
ncbi:MAG: efflux RND transporter periplasmic adaptor subunit [Gammaproteobacteria bacterium]